MAGVLLVAACGSPNEIRDPGQRQGRDVLSSGSPLVVAVGGEPRTLVPFVGASPSSTGDHLFDLVHASLVVLDDQARPIARVARELPSVERGTWRVNEDGSMETVWRLRPNVRWHDGQPFTAADVVFSWRVFNDAAVPVDSRRVARLIESVDSPDQHTVVMRWRTQYAFADHLGGFDLTLLPRHLLEATYELRREQFAGHPYWRTQFVGLGPYQVTRWPAGSSIELSAFDGYFLGRPSSPEVSVRFMADDSAAMAAALAAQVDVLLPRRAALGVVRTLRDRWRSSGEATLSVLPGYGWIFLAPQFAGAQPEDLMDVQVRRALVHSLDRGAIAEAVTGDASLGSELWVPESDPRYAQLTAGILRYPYDPSRARKLFHDAGWRREGADDGLVKQGRRFEIELATVARIEETAAVVADYWRDGGVAVRETVFSLGAVTDRQARAAYSGMEVAAGVPNLPLLDSRLHSANAPSASNQWVGANRGRYASAQLDDLLDRLWSTLDGGRRDAVEREIAQHIAGEVAIVPLAFYPAMAMNRSSVHNVRPPRSVAQVGRLAFGWNAHEWKKS